MGEVDFEAHRRQLVEMLKVQGILRDPEVIRAMLTVPRENFVPEHLKKDAYIDSPLPISKGQTISAPHMVAMMCEALEVKEGYRILEVGAGSGYHAAVIAEAISPKGSRGQGHIYTIEIVEELGKFAERNLERTSYGRTVTVIRGDGSKGLPEHAPFDRILVTASAPSAPQPLIDQLKLGGILVTPIGAPYSFQTLRLVRKNLAGEMKVSDLCGVSFVPLRGEYGWKD